MIYKEINSFYKKTFFFLTVILKLKVKLIYKKIKKKKFFSLRVETNYYYYFSIAKIFFIKITKNAFRFSFGIKVTAVIDKK